MTDSTIFTDQKLSGAIFLEVSDEQPNMKKVIAIIAKHNRLYFILKVFINY
jgi:hypothetical protein